MDGFWQHLPATLAAIGAIIATILAHKSAAKQRKVAKEETATQFTEQNVKIAEASVKLDDIKETANGTLENALQRIKDLELIVAELRKQVNKQ